MRRSRYSAPEGLQVPAACIPELAGPPPSQAWNLGTVLRVGGWENEWWKQGGQGRNSRPAGSMELSVIYRDASLAPRGNQSFPTTLGTLHLKIL